MQIGPRCKDDHLPHSPKFRDGFPSQHACPSLDSKIIANKDETAKDE